MTFVVVEQGVSIELHADLLEEFLFQSPGDTVNNRPAEFKFDRQRRILVSNIDIGSDQEMYFIRIEDHPDDLLSGSFSQPGIVAEFLQQFAYLAQGQDPFGDQFNPVHV